MGMGAETPFPTRKTPPPKLTPEQVPRPRPLPGPTPPPEPEPIQPLTPVPLDGVMSLESGSPTWVLCGRWRSATIVAGTVSFACCGGTTTGGASCCCILAFTDPAETFILLASPPPPPPPALAPTFVGTYGSRVVTLKLVLSFLAGIWPTVKCTSQNINPRTSVWVTKDSRKFSGRTW